MKRVWQLALLAFVIGVCALYLWIGAHVTENFQNDAAYYFGVARYIARTGRIAEPIVWHFLAPPAHVVHPAFDYWGGLTSLVLAPVLAVDAHAAFVAMALISAASVVALYVLVTRAAPMRHPVCAALAVVVFALSPGMAAYRFDTESIALYHLVLLLALIAFARGRYALAVLGGALLVFTRPDGVFTCLTIFVASLVMLPRARWRPVIGVAAGAAAVYVGYNLIAFGSVTTQASRALFIFDQKELYAYGAHPGASLHKLGVLLGANYLRIRALMIVQALRLAHLVPYPDVWLAFAGVASIVGWRCLPPVARVAAVALVASLFFVVWSEPAVFAPWRSYHPRLPLLVLAGCYGLDALASLVAGKLKRPEPAVGLALLAVAVVIAAQLRVYGRCAPGSTHDEIVEMRRLDPVLGGRTVASDLPWHVIANTSSPAISIPGNGEAAMIAAFQRYDVGWLLFGGRHSSTAGSTQALSAIAQGKRDRLGPFRLERVPAGAGVQLFRLMR